MIVRIVNFALQIGMGAESNKENPTLASKETVTRCFIDENLFQFALQENKTRENVSKKKQIR